MKLWVDTKNEIYLNNAITDKSNPLHVPLDGKIFSIHSEQWEWMTSSRLKGCKCTYEIIN